MKYLVALALGLLVGVGLFVVGLIYNPLVSQQGVSPLAVTDSETITLQYTGVPGDNIVYTNDGESRVSPHPEKVLQLWEAPIRQTTATAVVIRDARNQVAGIGIKMSSLSEKTRLLRGKVIFDSVWYVFLPDRGGVFVSQSENRWSYLRDIIVPAYRSSAKTWKGSWSGNITDGPGALGTAHVSGGSGEFLDKEMLGVESLSVRAWSALHGPVSAEGWLTIEMPSEIVPESLAESDLQDVEDAE